MKAILSFPRVYSLFRGLVLPRAMQEEIVTRYLRPAPGDRLLDIGCGPADMVAFLPPSVAYDGFDESAAYIDTARRRYGDRGSFTCERVSVATLRHPGGYDLVHAYGVLHHLDDNEAKDLFALAHAALKPGGRLVTFDGVYTDDQSALARWVLANDRGTFVREEMGYRRLAETIFEAVTTTIRHDMLRVPFSMLVMESIRRP